MNSKPTTLFDRGRAIRGRVEKPLASQSERPLDAARGAALEESSTFPLLEEFPELRIGIFAKRDNCRSDGEAAQELGFQRVAAVNQVHGAVIHVVREPVHKSLEGDGLITDQPNLALSVRWADCQNFVMYEPKKRVVGVLHAGWRGLAQGAITSFFHTLQQRLTIDPRDVLVGAGPSLCRRCAVFTDPLHELPAHLHRFTEGNRADLQAAADDELLSLGVLPSHLERLHDCTACQSDRYWTSRGGDREEVQSGHARNYLVAGIAS